MQLIPLRTIPASVKQGKLSEPRPKTIYDFGSIQFSDTLMTAGYCQIAWQNKVTKFVRDIY